MFNHLLCDSLRSHEHPCDIHLEHGVGILGRVIKCGRFLLDTRCRNQAIHSSLLLGDVCNDRIQLGHITHINLAIMQRRTEFSRCAFLNSEEIRGRVFETVKAIYFETLLSADETFAYPCDMC